LASGLHVSGVDNPKSRDGLRRKRSRKVEVGETKVVGSEDYIAAGRSVAIFISLATKQALESNKEWKRKAKGVRWSGGQEFRWRAPVPDIFGARVE
jgi:hypothetical protein